MFVYLDNSATTKPYIQVVKTMMNALEKDFGNPSAMYSLGIDAEKLIRKSRESVKDLIGKGRGEIFFTSGGTESDNMAIICGAMKNGKRGKKIITTKVEHPAVLESMKLLEKRGYDVKYLNVDKYCNIDISEFNRELSDDVALISIMAANNEIGTVYPIQDLYERKSPDTIFHSDCVQALGKMRLHHVDLMSFSGHKIHGPKGIGGIYIKKGISIHPYIVGGGQEKHMRSGTENVPGIVGFGKACEISRKNLSDNGCEKISKLKRYFKENIENEISDIRVNTPENSLSTILNVSFLGTKSEVILHRLEEDGIYVSAGSACSSNKKGESHVLRAMGLSKDEIEGALRFSLSGFTTEEELDYTLDKLKKAVESFRSIARRR